MICLWRGFEFDLANGCELFPELTTKLRFFPVEGRDGMVTSSLSTSDAHQGGSVMYEAASKLRAALAREAMVTRPTSMTASLPVSSSLRVSLRPI